MGKLYSLTCLNQNTVNGCQLFNMVQHGLTWFNYVQLIYPFYPFYHNYHKYHNFVLSASPVRTQTWAALARPPELHPRDMDLSCSGSVDHRDTWALTQCLVGWFQAVLPNIVRDYH
jgi:hypothetical protein